MRTRCEKGNSSQTHFHHHYVSLQTHIHTQRRIAKRQCVLTEWLMGVGEESNRECQHYNRNVMRLEEKKRARTHCVFCLIKRT